MLVAVVDLGRHVQYLFVWGALFCDNANPRFGNMHESTNPHLQPPSLYSTGQCTFRWAGSSFRVLPNREHTCESLLSDKPTSRTMFFFSRDPFKDKLLPWYVVVWICTCAANCAWAGIAGGMHSHAVVCNLSRQEPTQFEALFLCVPYKGPSNCHRFMIVAPYFDKSPRSHARSPKSLWLRTTLSPAAEPRTRGRDFPAEAPHQPKRPKNQCQAPHRPMLYAARQTPTPQVNNVACTNTYLNG
jgi:hypothetical protein